ncbi:MAG: hypothetical protein JO290_05245 [Sphingomonadaceae bacterium]|nr:hypothetical protein [Sphingomonadaceae bacterium]
MVDFDPLAELPDDDAWPGNLPPEQLAALKELIAQAERELDAGLGVELNMDEIIAEGRARRAAEARDAAE